MYTLKVLESSATDSQIDYHAAFGLYRFISSPVITTEFPSWIFFIMQKSPYFYKQGLLLPELY